MLVISEWEACQPVDKAWINTVCVAVLGPSSGALDSLSHPVARA
jgi:hypothetical protein